MLALPALLMTASAQSVSSSVTSENRISMISMCCFLTVFLNSPQNLYVDI